MFSSAKEIYITDSFSFYLFERTCLKEIIFSFTDIWDSGIQQVLFWMVYSMHIQYFPLNPNVGETPCYFGDHASLVCLAYWIPQAYVFIQETIAIRSDVHKVQTENISLITENSSGVPFRW